MELIVGDDEGSTDTVGLLESSPEGDAVGDDEGAVEMEDWSLGDEEGT
jgi:hypothetical protein